MGNCLSSSDVEKSLADQQRQRAQVGPQNAFIPAGQYSNGPPPVAFDPMTGMPLNNQPPIRQPANTFHTSAIPNGQSGARGENENVIKGDGEIARKTGEVLIISYDLGTTACQLPCAVSSG